MSKKVDNKNIIASELGIDLVNRRPHAKEIFKYYDIDLLPHSSTDTILCEIFDWNGRNWRSTGKNLIGYIFGKDEISNIKKQLENTPKHETQIPDFEFTKEHVSELGFNIPSLFNIGFSGSLKKTKSFSLKVNKITRSRITNIDSLGIEIYEAFSKFTETKSKTYRKSIKYNYLSTFLFYAESVEIELEKDSGVDLGINFDVENVSVEVKLDTETKKKYKLTYKKSQAPFAAKFVKGKDFLV